MLRSMPLCLRKVIRKQKLAGMGFDWTISGCFMLFCALGNGRMWGIWCKGTKYMKEMQTALNQIGFTTQSYAYPAIFLILLLGLIGLVCLNGKRSGAITAIASGIAGVVGMVIIITSINS
jgi:hypothetical protein